MGICKCVRATLSSLSPRENRNTPPQSCSSSPHLPPPPLGFDPPLQPRWNDRVRREGGERGEKEMTAPQQVWRIGKEGERERRRKKRRVLFWWWASHHWGTEDETYAASGGAGAWLSLHTSLLSFSEGAGERESARKQELRESEMNKYISTIMIMIISTPTSQHYHHYHQQQQHN